MKIYESITEGEKSGLEKTQFFHQISIGNVGSFIIDT